jgi:hypothetical protein
MLKIKLLIFIVLFYLSNTNNIFLGDSKISRGHEKYFRTLVQANGYMILKNQNDQYKKIYQKFDKTEFINSSSKQIKFILTKQNVNPNKDYRIVLYTYLNGRKKDSIEFYRNFYSNEFESYTCMSYLDLKENKIWQIKYFSSDKIILYGSKKININGNIKTDSLYYLDESLEATMQKYNLYY